MAASVLQRPLIFHTFNDNTSLEKVNELMTHYLHGKTVRDLFGYLLHYGKGEYEFNLIDSIIKIVEKEE